MPYTQPGLADVHVNRPLTNIAIAFMQMQSNFVASRVFPNVPVGSKTDSYFTIPRGAWYRDEFEERRPGAESAGANYEVDTETYNCKVWALHHDVADQTRANQDQPLDLDRQAVDFLMQKGLIRMEKAWADEHLATNKWTFNVDGAASRSASFSPKTANNDVIRWNAMNATPIEDIRLVGQFIEQETGFMPNVLVVSRSVYNTLIDHDDIVGRLNRGQTSGPAVVNRQALAALFDLEEVLVMAGVRTTSDEGATDAYGYLGGDHALLAYRPQTPGLFVPSAGYTFNWTGYAASVMGGVEVSRFRMEHLKSDRVEAEMAWDQKIISKDLACWFNDIV